MFTIMFDDNDLTDFTNFTKPKNIIRNLNKNGYTLYFVKVIKRRDRIGVSIVKTQRH